MAGLVTLLTRWSTRWRTGLPAEVVRSCSNVLGRMMASVMKLHDVVSVFVAMLVGR